MIDIWYIDIASISEQDFSCLLAPLPDEEKATIMKYHFYSDRCLKLLGRILIDKYFSNDLAFTWDQFAYSNTGKPYCSSSTKFNVSHSGTIVAVAFSSAEIGFDIELKNANNVDGIKSFFHQEEIELLERSDDFKSCFFKIWTRKEAFLKAKGVGIVNGLNQHNCLLDKIVEIGETWSIREIDLVENYAAAICQSKPIEEIKLKLFTKEELLKHVNDQITIT